MKERLRKFLRKWLGIEEVHDVCVIQDQKINKCTSHIMQAEQTLNMITDVVRVGVDFSTKPGESWAVVCIAGKPTYVNFYKLRHGDAREVLEIFKNYGIKRDNIRFDGPMGIEKYLE